MTRYITWVGTCCSIRRTLLGSMLRTQTAMADHTLTPACTASSRRHTLKTTLCPRAHDQVV